jgi:hypothetical protein
MKISGVSFTAAASPMPMPAGRPRATRQTSMRINASRMKLIWPRYSVWYIGSSVIAQATIAAMTVRDGR